FAIANAHVFDGESIIDNAAVIVENGRIASVEAAANIPDNIDIVDGTGDTLLPGLIDSHTHVWNGVDDLRLAIRYGVATELDVGMHPRIASEIKSIQA